MMSKTMPKYLYKYRNCDIDKHWKALREQVVWCGTLNNYNDPYEGYTTVNFLFVYKEFLKNIKLGNYNSKIDEISSLDELLNFAVLNTGEKAEVIEAKFLEQKNFIEQRNAIFRDKNIKDTAICAFAEEYDNRLMWAHYSNYHKGFCIGYETNQMEKFLYKVQYVKTIFDISNDLIKIMNTDSTCMAKKIKPHKMVIRKDSIWKYEKEWRLINPINYEHIINPNFDKQKNENNGYTYKLKPCIIYLGAKIEDRHKINLIEIAKEQNFTVKQIYLDEKKYNLSCETVYEKYQ